MRLIDADALVNQIVFRTNLPYEVKETVEDIINDTPTVEPERKTGKWVEDTEQTHIEKCWYCSECGYKAWGQYEKTDFCGGCGAKMEEGGADDE